MSELLHIAFIGDRLVDTACSLGRHPALMATALIPMIEEKFPLTRQIECTACVMDKKQDRFVRLAQKMGIERIFLEKSPDKNLNPATIAPILGQKGFSVRIADFSQGNVQGILNTGTLLELPEAAQKLAQQYKAELYAARQKLPKNTGKKILVLLGIRNPVKQTVYLLVEDHGAVNDEILSPAGCENVGQYIREANGITDTEEICLVHSLQGIDKARPDIIVLTGDPGAGLRAVYQHLRLNPEQKKLPVFAEHQIFSLPHCCAAEPMALPQTLCQWAEMLCR